MYFSDEKAAQMTAYFLQKRGGRMSYLKLMKLLYLADRESMNRCGESISADHHYSMKNGPILSHTYNLMTGGLEDSVWADWIAAESNFEVSLRKIGTDRDDLDELSDFDVEILEQIWQEFGHKTRWDLVDYTHDHLPEWKDPGYSSIPIDPRAQFQALGKTPEEAASLHDSILEKRAIAQALSELS